MSSAPGTTTAIVIGASAGTLAAFMAGGPHQVRVIDDPGPLARAPESPSPNREPAVPSAPSAAAATATVAAPSATAAPLAPRSGSNELDLLPVAELEKRCAYRQPASCSASARAFASGRGAPADAAKARVYRALAVTLLDERCLARDAESCHDLAVLYEKGTGVEQSADTAAALLQRARQLCTGKTSSFCDRLGASLK
jgi:TPR repeat protein